MKVSINSNLNFTMWVFALDLVNYHDIHKKYDKIEKQITLSILIEEVILFNQIWKGGKMKIEYNHVNNIQFQNSLIC